MNTLRLRQNGPHFAEDIFKCIFLNENVWIPIKISLKFVSKCPFNSIPALFQIMAWCLPGDKPLSEPMRVNLLTHMCITWPQWVKICKIVMRPAYLYDGIAHTGKTASLYWGGPQTAKTNRLTLIRRQSDMTRLWQIDVWSLLMRGFLGENALISKYWLFATLSDKIFI